MNRFVRAQLHVLAIFFWLIFPCQADVQPTLWVGVYNYSPLVFVDEQNQARGLFVDVLDELANQEGWKLEYLPGSWSENLDRLENNVINLLVNVAETDERINKFDFTQQHLYLDWGMVYRRKGTPIDTIFDLKGKRIAVLKDAFYTGELKKLLEQFSIQAEFVEKNEFAAVFSAIESLEVDVGVNSNLASFKLPYSSTLERTAIVFAPTKLRFATKKGANRSLLEKLDAHMLSLYADRNSVYYDLQQKWLGHGARRQWLPAWLAWVMTGLFCSIGLLASTSYLLQRQVKRKTSDLRQSEESLAITLQSIGDAVIATDTAGRITRMNTTAEQLTGWKLDDAKSRPLAEVFSIINAETRQQVTDPVQQVIERGQVVGLANHTVLLARDGNQYQIADSAAPIRNAAGSIVGVVLVFSDVSERYRMEQALNDSEQRYRMLVESMQDLMTKVDTQGKFTFVNNAAQTVFGVTQQECLGLSAFEFVHPDDRDATQKAFGEWLQTGKPTLKFENRQISRQGVIHLMQWNMAVDQSKTGEVVGFSAVARDVTEMRRSEQEIRQGRTELANTLAMLEVTGRIAKVGSWSFDVLTSKLWWSEETYRIHELDPAQSINVACAIEFYAPQARDAIGKAVKDCIETGQAFDHELALVTAKGRTIWVRAQGHADMQDGKTVRLMGAFQDITERKLVQDALRTSLLEKEALLREVHHRVKNNLQVINSLLRLESGRSKQPDTQSVLVDMQGRIRAMALLHELLYRSGTFAAVDLSNYLGQIGTQTFRSLLTQSGTIQLQLDLAPVKVGMDQAMPCGLLLNELISNCLKHGFVNGNGGEVRVELHELEGKLRLRVSDTGVGLGENFESKLTHSLGLQLVSDLTNQLGGALVIGPGSVFTVSFTRRAELMLRATLE